MKYYLYSVNSNGMILYLADEDAKACTLWDKAPIEYRYTFEDKDVAEYKRKLLDKKYENKFIKHYIREVK